MIEVGANPKDVRGQSATPASSTIYGQHVPESQRRAVDKMMETVIFDGGTTTEMAGALGSVML